MRLAVPRVSLTTSPLRLQTEITSSSLSRVAINSVGDSFNRFCTTRCPIKFSCTRWKSSLTPGLQQRQGFAGKPAGHIAGKLSGIIRMKRLLYHNVEGAFNRADILRQRKRLRLPENGLALGVRQRKATGRRKALHCAAGCGAAACQTAQYRWVKARSAFCCLMVHRFLSSR